MKIYVSLITALLFVGCVYQLNQATSPNHGYQQNAEITIEELSEHIKYLASDELGGRFPGTPESKLAQDYIIRQYKNANIAPLGEDGYLQHFNFVSSVVLGTDNHLKIDDVSYEASQDYIPLGFSANGALSAEAVFVGYGFAIDDSVKWNDYSNINAEGKWVVILRGGPEDDNPHSMYNSHLPLRKKVLIAKDNNAVGVLLVNQDSNDNDLLKLRYDNSFSGAGIPVLHISQNAANNLFKNSKQDFKTAKDKLKSNHSPNSFDLPEVTIAATVELKKTTSNAANIVAFIPGNDPKLKNEYVVIGGHYDHLGMGGPGSGSRVPDTLAIHNGADDNASGTAGVMEIGEKLAAISADLRRSVVLINFDAEERGLLGSKYYINNPTLKSENIVAMLNLDMVGHLTDSMLTIGGTGTSPIFEELLNDLNGKYNTDLKLSPEGYGPSDHATFYSNNIPVLFFFTGTHDDYHKPSDDFQIINLEGEKLISDFVYDVALSLSQLPEKPLFTEAGPKEAPAPSRRFKVTFGIIPAYGSQAEGMEIDGVRKGGPADLAGMQKGDIITAIEGKDVTSIYDYMYRLGELKKGQVVSVAVLRGDKSIILTLEL